MPDNIQTMNEAFLAPIGLKPILQIDKIKLYSSDKLQDKFIDILSDIPQTKESVDKIQELLTKGAVKIVFSSKNFLHFSLYKLLSGGSTKSLLGFFSPTENYVVVVLDNNSNIFSYANNKAIAQVLTHEVGHYIASNNSKLFYSTFKNTVVDFYESVFTELFSIPKSVDRDKLRKACLEFFTYMFFKIEKLSIVKPEKVKEVNDMMCDIFLPLFESNELRKSVKDKINFLGFILRIYLTDFGLFYQSIPKYKDMLLPLYHAYHNLTGEKIHSLCVQEFLFPSEIICILSEYDTTISKKIYSLV